MNRVDPLRFWSSFHCCILLRSNSFCGKFLAVLATTLSLGMERFNHRIPIPVTILRGAENQVIFDSDITDWMCAAGVDDIGDGSRVEPLNDADHREEYRAWKLDHSKTKTIIKRLLSEDVKLVMYGAIPVNSKVHEILQWIRDEYGNADSTEMQDHLMEKIKALKLSSFSEYGKFLLTLQGLYSRYLATGGTLSAAERKKYLFDATKDLLMIEVRALKARGAGVTFREASEVLESAYMSLKGNSAQAAINSAQTTRSTFQCFCCLSSDHGVRQCPFVRGGKPLCLFCFEHGHWSSKCRTKKCKAVNYLQFDSDSDEEVVIDSDSDDFVFKY